MVSGAMSLPGRCECKIHCKCGKEKALRVIPRGKQRLTVYRAHQMTRIAFSALRVIRLKGKFASRMCLNFP